MTSGKVVEITVKILQLLPVLLIFQKLYFHTYPKALRSGKALSHSRATFTMHMWFHELIHKGQLKCLSICLSLCPSVPSIYQTLDSHVQSWTADRANDAMRKT